MSLRPDSMMARSTLRPMRPKPLIATRTAMSSSVASEPARRFRDRLGRNAEMPIEIRRLARSAKAFHADKSPSCSQPAFPAKTRRRLAGDAPRALRTEDLRAICVVLAREQLPGWHGHSGSRNAVFGQKLARGDRQMDLGTRGDQPDLGRRFACQNVGAALAGIVVSR